MEQNVRGKSCSELNSLSEKDYPEIPECHDFPENHENHEKYVFDEKRKILMCYDKRDGRMKPVECEVLSNEHIPYEDPNDPEEIWEAFKQKWGYDRDNLPKSPLDEKRKIMEDCQENNRRRRKNFAHRDKILPDYTSLDHYDDEEDNYRRSDTEEMEQIVQKILAKTKTRKKEEKESTSELSDLEQEILTILHPEEKERSKFQPKEPPDIEENYVNKAVEIPCFYELPEDNYINKAIIIPSSDEESEEMYVNPSLILPVPRDSKYEPPEEFVGLGPPKSKYDTVRYKMKLIEEGQKKFNPDSVGINLLEKYPVKIPVEENVKRVLKTDEEFMDQFKWD